MARITGCDRIAGGVAGGGSAGIGSCGGVIAILAAAPLHGSQGQGFAVVRGGLGDKGQVGVGQVGIGAGGGQAFCAGLVALGLHGDRGIVQRQQAGIAVLGCDLPMGVQLFQDRREIVGVAVLGDGVGVVLGVHPHLVLFYHVQQEIPPPVALKVLRRDAGRVIGQGKLVHFVDTQLVKAAVGVLLHGDGIERPTSSQRRGRGDADCQDSGAQQHQDSFFHSSRLLSMFYQRELESPRPWPLTVRMPSRVVAVMRRRSAVAMSFFTVSSMLRPQTTRTRERRR